MEHQMSDYQTLSADDFSDIEDIPETPAYTFTTNDGDQAFDTEEDARIDLGDMDKAQRFTKGEATITNTATGKQADVREWLDSH